VLRGSRNVGSLSAGCQQFEKVPLWNQRNVFVGNQNSAYIDADLGALDLHVQCVDLAVRHPGEIVGQTEFVEQSQRAGMHGVAAEVAQEVGVFLHHHDVDAAAGERQAQRDSCGAAAGDDAGVFSVVSASAGTR